MKFDASRARLYGPDWFPRFRVAGEAERLADAGLEPTTQIVVADRGDERLAFLVEQMAYHHVAQGRLAGEPFVVAF